MLIAGGIPMNRVALLPHFLGDFPNKCQLGPLLVLGQLVAHLARCETTLGA